MRLINLTHPVLEENASARLVRGLVARGWLFPFVAGDALYVLNLVVSQKVGRTGLGAKLMAMAEEKAKSESLKSIHLDIATNTKANTFFSIWVTSHWLKPGFANCARENPRLVINSNSNNPAA
jgi:N-acetylglutamate synthase-like GNAT family acetyltransferase